LRISDCGMRIGKDCAAFSLKTGCMLCMMGKSPRRRSCLKWDVYLCGGMSMKIRSAGQSIFLAAMMALALVSGCPALCQDTGAAESSSSGEKHGPAFLNKVSDYLKMADVENLQAFHPMTQKERNRNFTKSLINPVWYLKGALSAGLNQASDKPEEWEQGMSGYGKRYGDIMGQYAIRNTVMFGFESLLHEDNRYFGSRKKGFWPRTGYALSGGLLARHDNGKRYPSASLLIGFASGAGLSRLWQPASENSFGDAAISFGISLGWNTGFAVVKEFLPDLLRPLMKGGKAQKAAGQP
jgi:hypothetical protein